MIIKTECWHGMCYILTEGGDVYRIIADYGPPIIEKLGYINHAQMRSVEQPILAELFPDPF